MTTDCTNTSFAPGTGPKGEPKELVGLSTDGSRSHRTLYSVSNCEQQPSCFSVYPSLQDSDDETKPPKKRKKHLGDDSWNPKSKTTATPVPKTDRPVRNARKESVEAELKMTKEYLSSDRPVSVCALIACRCLSSKHSMCFWTHSMIIVLPNTHTVRVSWGFEYLRGKRILCNLRESELRLVQK